MIALSDALSAAGFTTSLVPSFRGADPVLRTRYRVGTAGAPQSVRVSLPAAAASLRSARYLRVNGEAPLELPATPPRWSRPPVPLGTHPPEWPERE